MGKLKIFPRFKHVRLQHFEFSVRFIKCLYAYKFKHTLHMKVEACINFCTCMHMSLSWIIRTINVYVMLYTCIHTYISLQSFLHVLTKFVQRTHGFDFKVDNCNYMKLNFSSCCICCCCFFDFHVVCFECFYISIFSKI